MDVAQSVVMHDLALSEGNKPHTAHIGRQLVNLIEGAFLNRERRCAISRLSQVKKQEFISRRRCKFVLLDINTTDPIPFVLEFLDEMPTDETSRATN